MRATVALALALAIATPAVARADRSARVPGTNLSVRVAGSSLEVKQQRTVAPIPVPQPWPDLFLDVTAEAKGDVITIWIGTNCSGDRTIKTTEAALRARLANVSALGLHRGKQWDAAAAGFAKALALDPTLVPAALNLASAQARGGHRDAAIATLVTLAATEPRLVAWRVVVDPDLLSLGDAPALRALDAKTPGTATGPALTTLGVAASPELGLYARVATLGNSMAEDAGSSSLEIVEVATGRVLIREGAISGPALERGLRALGMRTDGIARITLDSDGGKRKGVFPGTRLGVVMASDHARVVTGNRVLGEVALPTGYGAWAARLPFGVLVASQISIGDGCGGYDYEEAALIPVTAAPPAPAKPAR